MLRGITLWRVQNNRIVHIYILILLSMKQVLWINIVHLYLTILIIDHLGFNGIDLLLDLLLSLVQTLAVSTRSHYP